MEERGKEGEGRKKRERGGSKRMTEGRCVKGEKGRKRGRQRIRERDGDEWH